MTTNNNKDDFTNMVAVPIANDEHLVKKKKKVTFADKHITNENLANQLKNALNDRKMQQFAEKITEATQQFEEIKRRNDLSQHSTQHSQNAEASKSKKTSKFKNLFAKSKKEHKTVEISSPSSALRDDQVMETNVEFVSIKHPAERKEGKVHDGNFNFLKRQSHNFVFEAEDKSEDVLSSTLFNSIDQESFKDNRSMSSFSSNSFEFTKPESDITSNKLENKRSVSIDSGISSLADASNISKSNESLASTISQDSGFTNLENSVDKKAEIIKDSNFATTRRARTNSKLIKVAIPTVPTFKPITSGLGIQKSANPIEEKKTSFVEDQKSPKEKLLSKIDEFIPKVNVSRRKTTGEKSKYSNLDRLRVEAGQLDLKIKAIDSLLKNKPLMKIDKNNNNILLTTKKDVPLLKELKRDLKKEFRKVNKEQKRISIYDKQEQKRLQDKVLKNDVEKIREIISTAKLQTNMGKRFDLLYKLQIDLESAYSHLGKKLDSSLKEVMKELHKEKWAAATNDKLDKLLFDKAELTFEDKKAIYESKRFYTGQLRLGLASPGQQKCSNEDKKTLRELYGFYEKLAKSSENKPQDKANLDNAFNREFRSAYKQARQDREKEEMEKTSSPVEGKESKVPETKMSGTKIEQAIPPLTVQNI